MHVTSFQWMYLFGSDKVPISSITSNIPRKKRWSLLHVRPRLTPLTLTVRNRLCGCESSFQRLNSTINTHVDFRVKWEEDSQPQASA